MKRGPLLLGVLVGAGVLGGLAWWRHSTSAVTPAAPPESSAVATAPSPAVEPPAIAHPLPAPAEVDTAAPLTLADSDAALRNALVPLAGEATLLQWLVPDELVRRFVATVDNLPRAQLAERLRPLQPVPGAFRVERAVTDATEGEERIVLAESNHARYDGAIAAFQALDMQQVAIVYRRFYPLCQSAYESLGYPDRYFNDRVVEVIDHLLATPTPEGPLPLVQPKVMYHYADAGLEALSAGQKLLIRMGSAHAAVVKAQLTALRAQISSSKE